MIFNDWQNFFLTKFTPILESLGSTMEIFAYIVLFVLLPMLVYSCKKNIGRCYIELKHQNNFLQSQTQTIDELNSWMQYFDDKIIKNEQTSSQIKSELDKVPSANKFKNEKVASQNKQNPFPDKNDHASIPPTPISLYKKTI